LLECFFARLLISVPTPPEMAGPDPLFVTRAALHTGAYQRAVNHASEISDSELSEQQQAERDCLLKRAFVALRQPSLALSSSSSCPSDPAILAADALAQHALAHSEAEMESARQSAQSLLDSTFSPPDHPLAASICATILSRCEGERESAMRVCASAASSNSFSSLEARALLVQLLIAHNRPDVAEKHAQAMQSIDEDETITQLAVAFSCLASPRPALNEAATIVSELADKFGSTARLSALSAMCNLLQDQFDEAERELSESLAESSQDADTIALLVVASIHTHKGYQRFLSQLKTIEPSHPLVKRFAVLDEAFDRAAATFGGQ